MSFDWIWLLKSFPVKHMCNFMLKVYGKVEGHYTKTDCADHLQECIYYENSSQLWSEESAE